MAVAMATCTACGSVKTVEQSTVETETTETTEMAARTEDLLTQEQHGETVVVETMTVAEFVKYMGNGINLGNTLEAYGHKELGTMASVSEYESLWGQPQTTQEMIDGMKASGFDTLRIPVAWTNVMNYETGDYTIREDYLERVAQIADWAIDADMCVVIDAHWDGGWWGMFGSQNQDTRNQAMEMYTAMWQQISEYFKEYPAQLVFESGNEELGSRLNDIDVCVDSGCLNEDECYETTNQINQKFVDIVRGTGGKNTQRFLLIAGYNTDIEHTCDERFVMPTDVTKDKLMVSVHYYNPWTYCGTDSVNRWGSKKQYEEQHELLAKMQRFTEQGYGVVIGEYAALVRSDGTIKENTADFISSILNNCDEYGYCPILWDCNNLYSKESCEIISDDIASIFKNRNLQMESQLSNDAVVEQAKQQRELAYEAAPESLDEDIDLESLDKPMAWIMYNSQDWSVTYSAGDVYDPESKSDGVIATDVEVDGEGTYRVALDFSGTAEGNATGMGFSALAISNGELLYPNYVINIEEVLINKETYELKGTPYTISDDGKCTRVNLYNEWVNEVPLEARISKGDKADVSAILFDNDQLKNIKSIEIVFSYEEMK